MDTTYLTAMRVAREDGENARKLGYAQNANPFKNTPFQNAWLHGWISEASNFDSTGMKITCAFLNGEIIDL